MCITIIIINLFYVAVAYSNYEREEDEYRRRRIRGKHGVHKDDYKQCCFQFLKSHFIEVCIDVSSIDYGNYVESQLCDPDYYEVGSYLDNFYFFKKYLAIFDICLFQSNRISNILEGWDQRSLQFAQDHTPNLL